MVAFSFVYMYVRLSGRSLAQSLYCAEGTVTSAEVSVVEESENQNLSPICISLHAISCCVEWVQFELTV